MRKGLIRVVAPALIAAAVSFTTAAEDTATAVVADAAPPPVASVPEPPGISSDEFRGGRPDGRPDLRAVHGVDDRFWIDDTTAWPWRTVCKVVADFPNGKSYVGSAVMIGPSAALTAAHVVHSADDGGWATYVEVIPGFDDGYEPYGYAVAEEMWTWAGWTDSEDQDYDLALLNLDTAIGNSCGWLGYGWRSDSALVGATLNSAGYPGDLRELYGADYMWGMTGPIAGVSEQEIRYDLWEFDAYQGQSGSGTWLREGEARTVVGVVAYCYQLESNRGPRITAERFYTIKAWAAGYDSAPDLVLAGLQSSVAGSVDRGATVQATATVRNDGGAPASSVVNLYLARSAADRTLVASRGVNLQPGGVAALDIPVTVPAGHPVGQAYFEARVNEDFAADEDDWSNNARTTGWFSVTAPAMTLVPGAWRRDYVGGSESLRYALTIPSGVRSATFSFKGRKCTAGASGPGGESFTIGANRKVSLPSAGVWTIDVRNLSDDVRSTSLRVKLKY